MTIKYTKSIQSLSYPPQAPPAHTNCCCMPQYTTIVQHILCCWHKLLNWYYSPCFDCVLTSLWLQCFYHECLNCHSNNLFNFHFLFIFTFHFPAFSRVPFCLMVRILPGESNSILGFLGINMNYANCMPFPKKCSSAFRFCNLVTFIPTIQ